MTVLISALLAILAVLCLFAFSCTLIFWYESLSSPEPRIPQPQPGILICIFRYGRSLVSGLGCVILALLGPLLRKHINSPPGFASDLPPLVLIHGIYNNAGCWLYLARKLRQAGYPVSAFVYSSMEASPERIAADLDACLRTWEERPDSQKPVLICHSLGGLIARLWALEAGNQERVHGIITLATPHGGSKLAALGLGKLVKNIRPDSILMQTLEHAPAITQYCAALAGPGDEAVLPPSALLPPASWRFRLTASAGHFGMLFHPQVAAALLAELDHIRSQ